VDIELQSINDQQLHQLSQAFRERTDIKELSRSNSGFAQLMSLDVSWAKQDVLYIILTFQRCGL
jgi:hypothetical protein